MKRVLRKPSGANSRINQSLASKESMVADAAPSSKLEENEQIIELNAEFVNG